jgi:hypothetical protein
VLERAVAVHLGHDERNAVLEAVRRRLVDRDAPPRTACGTSSRDAEVPTEKSATSIPPAASASGVASSIAIPSISVPAERLDANRRTSS